MCGHFLKRMENYQGDLTDIIRAGAAGVSNCGGTSSGGLPVDHWQFPSNPIIYPGEDFGDPFTQLGDPLLDVPVTGFFNQGGGVFGGGNVNGSNEEEILSNEMKRAYEMKRASSNKFSRMLQISPGVKVAVAPPSCESPAGGGAGMLVCSSIGNDHQHHHHHHHHGVVLSSPNSSKGCLVESPAALQISSPRITGIKRRKSDIDGIRKSQAKKVVSIPAPAPANSRPSGEVVPSDLWAWRKYGQKPIKGSPYPRGYYRCSSSKGCSARKQVERSRTNPNMLVITYTSEHNHPWPTQRNALAGSTRSQPSKTPHNPKTNTTTSSPQKCKESEAPVKQELDHHHHQQQQQQQQQQSGLEEIEGFSSSAGYKPLHPPPEDSFFADLEEIEGDNSRLDLLLCEGGFSNSDDKSLDPFSFYDD